MFADSLRFTSAVSILLAAVFMLISMGIALYALFSGTAKVPRMLPDFSRLSSPFELFTAVPVIVVAFTFHFNGTYHIDPSLISRAIHSCTTRLKLMGSALLTWRGFGATQCTRSGRS